MKHILCIMALTIMTISTSHAQWHQVNSNTNNNISDMYFLNDTLGYAIAPYTILQTNDSGENWFIIHQDSALFSQLSIVTTPDSLFCFSQDFMGNYYKITAQHHSNSYHKSMISYSPISPVYFHNHLWFVTSDNTSLNEYSNGQRTPMAFGAEDFFVRGNFIAYSNATEIYYSLDYGVNWQMKVFFQSALSSQPYYGYFNGNDTLYAITNYPFNLHYSYNQGDTWQYTNTNFRTQDYIYFYNSQKFIGLTRGIDNTNVIFRTANAAQEVAYDTLQHPLKYAYIHGSKVFVYGDNGIIYSNENPWLSTNLIVPQPALLRINISPNPTADYLNLDIPAGINVQSIKLYNVQGELLKQFANNSRQLNILNYPAGLYIVSIQTQTDVVSTAIIKY